MCACVEEMLKHSFSDPCFIVDYVKLGRGIENPGDTKNAHVVRSKVITCWRIVGEELKLLKENEVGIFFSAERYIIRWTFEYVSTNKEMEEETILYFWRGSLSAPGHVSLPTNYSNENTFPERIFQWCEPPVFFHIFSRIVTFPNGPQENFNPNIPHIFIVRGELDREIHLIEVPFLKKNLRSRGIFLIVLPSERTIYLWQGAAVPEDYFKLIRDSNSTKSLLELDLTWKNFDTKYVTENGDYGIFVGDQTDYDHITEITCFTPRLFYFSSFTGSFLATEVEYSLRCTGRIAAFPCLQSYLHSANQPALFLVDNNMEIWLWKGHDQDDSVDFKEQLKLAKETATKYAKEKERIIGKPVPVSYADAGSEPVQFTNIFPYWN